MLVAWFHPASGSRPTSRPPISATDFVLAVAAAMVGPILFAVFVPRALAPRRDVVDVGLVAMGALVCWMPISAARKALRG